MISQLQKDLQKVSDPVRAKHSQRFFKTGKGEYAEGDIFLGPSVPQCRELVRKYKDLSFSETTELLKSKYHEGRLIALLILVHNCSILHKNASEDGQKKIFDFYLSQTKYINNWDLVDLSAHKIVGAYLLDKPKEILFKLAKSENIWERRIAIISTFEFIKDGKFDTSLKIVEMLLNDKHDLIHKAVGWMLREVGKRFGQKVLTDFLDSHLRLLPRTTLRYAIERFDEKVRKAYLASK